MATETTPYGSGLPGPGPVLAPGQTYRSVTDKISGIVLTMKAPLFWFGWMAVGFALMQLFLLGVTVLLFTGTGVWGLNQPVGWGFAIINFVWWIGIGHAGTLISAILFLFRQQWRMSINRAAEAMTLFAVLCALQFPLFHTGRPWLAAYWLLPYPNTMGIWPNFRSPLIWDVFAVSTYGTISLVFWFTGLIPDLATMRDKAKSSFTRTIYGVLAMGWRGSAVHWQRYETAYMLLAGLSTPLVLSVHTVVSFDFAVSLIPGWHTTLFPPYFVAGAIYSGFAMVLTLLIPIRSVYGLKGMITDRHLDAMAKVMLATGWIVFYGYLTEAFVGWYSGVEYERFVIWNRMTGPYWWAFWALIFCNGVVPQVLWSKTIRTSPVPLFIVSILVNIGMWLERFVIVITSLHRDYLPSSWGMYSGTRWDWSVYLGTIGLFLTLFYLFVRVLPMISIFEMRELVHRLKPGRHVKTMDTAS
ncbi:MAG: NrfD/PsrC family molybdoenzyme membrane anchor subunit [Vicinamibacterales bacterium]